MIGEPVEDEIPAEIDFSKAARGLHHVDGSATIFLPASIEKPVWEYFADKAHQRGIGLSALLNEVLRRDIDIGEALK